MLCPSLAVLPTWAQMCHSYPRNLQVSDSELKVRTSHSGFTSRIKTKQSFTRKNYRILSGENSINDSMEIEKMRHVPGRKTEGKVKGQRARGARSKGLPAS